MKIARFSTLILASLTFTPAVQAASFIVGGKPVSSRDPISDSTVGVYSPGPDGKSGALCTGTLIKNDIALTAAHCLERGSKPELIFSPDLHAPGAVHKQSEGVAVNSQWQRRTGRGMDQGDIALVKFDGRLPPGYHAVPAATGDQAIQRGKPVILAGYGISNARSKTGAGRLRKTRVSILDSRPGKPEMILDQSHGHGACHGDSGGPAYVRSGKRLAVAGLTNRSYPDSAPDDCAHDVVYTKVPAYTNWIQKAEKKLEADPSQPSFRHPQRKLSVRRPRGIRPFGRREAGRVVRQRIARFPASRSRPSGKPKGKRRA